MPTPQDLLETKFGLNTFLPGQEQVIESLLAGHSTAAVFPTGGGKSLCYQLPALSLEGLTLVVSPLIALMKDQIDKLRRLGIAASQLDSTLQREEYIQLMDNLRGGHLRLLYVAPERFNNERFRQTIAGIPIAMMAIDEAHCISEWGHNFRPDYLKLAGYAQALGAERVLALTATATPQVLEDICRGFAINPQHAVRTPFYRPNLSLRFTPLSPAQRPEALLNRLNRPDRGSTIVYVTLQRTAEEVAAHLAGAGLPARAYHAGMKTEERTQVQEWFMASTDAIVASTIAFGMGIDKADIRAVLHYNVSKSLENYAQEIGRAGRDDLPSVCETLLCPEDRCTLENFAYGDTPELSAITNLINDLFSQPKDFDVSKIALSNTHDIRPLVLSTILTYLELDGYLEGGTPFYATYRFRPLVSSQEILAPFNGEPRAILTHIFRRATKGKTWFDIDLDACAHELGQPRGRLIRALDHLHDRQQLEVQTSGVRNRYRILRQPEPTLAAQLHQRSLAREQSEIARIQQVTDLASADACLASNLGVHFGESHLAAPCGTCTYCTTGNPIPLAAPAEPEIDPVKWSAALQLREKYPILASPRALTRFLCGLSSPHLSKAKAGKFRLLAHPLYGAFSHIPFVQVLTRAEKGSP